ncbi:uncharacterized protein LOC111400297 [Olea europaea var. sylvestris]|uniref:uncharacterized protein LOC111400297 n=1 Tax=Olea europaea var. sylvestris TaxID=158386 RepID=UPI000C1D6844|nr:uncharacterized protein LOC111400297 [Olea europaea var. sylvestris]
MASNIVGFVNAITKVAKNYNIVALLDSLKQTIQSLFYKKMDTTNDTFTNLSTKYEKLMREMSIVLKNMRVSSANQTIFSLADEGSSFVVDKKQRTCTCQILQVDQKPCPHILAVIAITKEDPYDYCLNLFPVTYVYKSVTCGNKYAICHLYINQHLKPIKSLSRSIDVRFNMHDLVIKEFKEEAFQEIFKYNE